MEVNARASAALRVLVLVLVCGATVRTSSPDISSGQSGNNHGTSGHGSHKANFTQKAFPVLAFDYEHVHHPFAIVLWILLASLMKLGKSGGFGTELLTFSMLSVCYASRVSL